MGTFRHKFAIKRAGHIFRFHSYLDNQATTPTDPRVRDAMLPFLETNSVGNPHSEHFSGRRAAMAVEDARGKSPN